MESTTCGEANYVCDQTIGSAFSSPLPGTAQIARVYNTNAVDHATITPGEYIPGYNTTEFLGLYAYPRYKSVKEQLLTVTGGGIQVDSNLVAGGAVWNWTYQGVQYLNHYDYGRLMQTAMIYDTSLHPVNCDTDSNKTRVFPTEAGDDASGCAGYNPDDFHGSPLISAAVAGSTQSTRAIPLDFNAGNGCTAIGNYPRMYKDFVFGKDITLGFNGMPGVARYVTTVTVPQTLTLSSGEKPELEVPTAYLNGNFRTFYTYDATNPWAPSAVALASQGGTFYYTPPSGYGGVMLSDTTQSGYPTMAMFATTNSANLFALLNFVDYPSGSNTSDSWNTAKMSALYQPAVLPAGTSTFTVWFLTGPLVMVEQQISQLYQYCGSHGGLACQ